MGAFYNSICLPRCPPQEARQALTRWLLVRGFEISDDPPLFDLDGENERSAFLISNERWTILFFSHYEEEARLIRELRPLSENLVYVWVHDSDVWGFDLFDQQGFSGSFSSNPRAYLPFDDEAPIGPERPPAEPAKVCELLALPGKEAALAGLYDNKAAFKEEICGEFCRLIGAEAALASYDELECGDGALFPGWRLEHLLFVRQRFDTAEIDLHADGLLERRFPAHLPRVGTELELPPELLAEMERMRRRARLFLLFLKPVSWLARVWRKLYEASFKLRGSRSGASPRSNIPLDAGADVLRANYRVDGSFLINERHGCRVTLADDVEPLPGSRKPSSVFTFKVAHVNVTCTARRLSKIDEILRQPSGSKLVRDELLTFGEQHARHFLFEVPSRLPTSQEPTHLGIYIVQTEQAFYVFLYRYRGRPEAELEQRIRQTVASFRLLAQRDASADAPSAEAPEAPSSASAGTVAKNSP